MIQHSGVVPIDTMARATRDDDAGAEPFVPTTRSLKVLREAAQDCRGCHLYKHATQAVFGEGPRNATLMFVGEIPGDKEDETGHVFVGPAGRMLDKALHEVRIDRSEVYITNIVKHFKYKRRGKRRIHDKPDSSEISACTPWLEAEVRVLKPSMLVALGATAAKGLFGSSFRVTKQRGVPIESEWAPWCVATVHPSSLLRAPDKEARARAWRDFLKDFKAISTRYAEAHAGAR